MNQEELEAFNRARPFVGAMRKQADGPEVEVRGSFTAYEDEKSVFAGELRFDAAKDPEFWCSLIMLKTTLENVLASDSTENVDHVHSQGRTGALRNQLNWTLTRTGVCKVRDALNPDFEMWFRWKE